MADATTNELLFEMMKNVQASVASLRLDAGELKGGMTTLSARVTSIDQRLALAHTDLALLSERMDHMEARMDGIEGCLREAEEGVSADPPAQISGRSVCHVQWPPG